MCLQTTAATQIYNKQILRSLLAPQLLDPRSRVSNLRYLHCCEIEATLPVGIGEARGRQPTFEEC